MFENIFDLTGRVAVVTGGAGSLGREAARGLAEYGAAVVIADRDREALKEVEDRLNELGYGAQALELDVTDQGSVSEAAGKILERQGKIDILVNAAGINIRRPVTELAENEWDKTVNINLKGTYLCCKIMGKAMVRQNRGKIVNFGSVSSLLGHPEHSAYAASKGGVLMFTKVLAMEWARNNINVNAVGPAYIETALTRDYLTRDGNYEKIVRSIPMGRLGSPADVVGAVIYLSSGASDFVTGTILMVDGGRTAD